VRLSSPITTINQIDLCHLPDYALASPEGLIKAIRLASLTTSASNHIVPIDAEYTNIHTHKEDPVRNQQLSALKMKIKSNKPSTIDNNAKQSAAVSRLLQSNDNTSSETIAEDESEIKIKCLKDYRTKGYPIVDNPFRAQWETKFNTVSNYFASKREIQKAINSTRRQMNLSYDDAFCALAYCDGNTTDALSRLMENNILRNDIMVVSRMFPIASIIDRVIDVYSTSNTNISNPQDKQEDSPKQYRRGVKVGVMVVADRKPVKLLPLHHPSHANPTIVSTSVDTSVVRTTSRFRRFNQEIDKRIEMSSSLQAISRRDAIKNDGFKLWKQIETEKRSPGYSKALKEN
jgi:hypothetical protein